MPEPTVAGPALEEDEDDLDTEEEPTPAPPPRAVPAGPGLVDRAWAAQRNLDSRVQAVGRGRIARVLRMARKPEPEEFRQSAIIVLVGIGIVGAFGFFTYLFMNWLLHAIKAT